MADTQTYEFQLKDGRTVQVQASSPEKAQQAFHETMAQQETQPVTAGGLLSQAGASLLKGGAYAAGLPGTIRDSMRGLLNKGLSKAYEGVTGHVPDPNAGIDPETGEVSGGGVERFFSGKVSDKVKKAIADSDNPIVKYLDKINPIEGPGIGSGSQAADVMSAATGGYSDRQPQNTAEEFVRTAGEFLPSGLMLGGAGALAPTLSSAVMSEGSGQLARKYLSKLDRPDYMPDFVPDVETSARIAGAFAGPTVYNAARKVISPNVAKPGNVEAAKAFEKEGIPTTAGQKTGNTATLIKESEIGGDKYADLIDRQKVGFNRAALKRIDETADYATPEVLNRAHKAVDKLYGEIKQNDLFPTPDMGRSLKKVVDTYKENAGPSNQAPVIENTFNDVVNYMKSARKMTGAQYQDMITKLRNVKGSPETMQAAQDLRNALDDAMEASIKKYNPDDLGKFTKARTMYRNLRSIEDTVATGAGGDVGNINPAKLNQVVTTQVGKSAKAQGLDDLGELSRHGVTLTRSLPNSGTPSRLAARGAARSSILGVLNQVPIAGPLASDALASLKSNLYMSKPNQWRLSNQLLAREPLTAGAPFKPTYASAAGRPPLPTPPASTGGLLRLLEQEGSAIRTKQARKYARGKYAK